VAELTKKELTPPLGTEIWGNTQLQLPESSARGRYRNVLTGETLETSDNGQLPLADLLAVFPVALLEKE
jgi:maltooligosyltrehalose synthase